jgi:hypothetical protein
MRGTVTLDFVFALVLLIATTASFFFLAFTQIENTAVASTQMRAETLAIATGSAINHFVAVGPAPGSRMELALGGVGDPEFGVYIGPEDCNVTFNTPANIILVEANVYRMESSQPETIWAQYPTVKITNECEGTTCSVDGILTVPCTSAIELVVYSNKIEVNRL